LFPGLLQGEKICVVSHGTLFIIQCTSAASRSVRTVHNTHALVANYVQCTWRQMLCAASNKIIYLNCFQEIPQNYQWYSGYCHLVQDGWWTRWLYCYLQIFDYILI